MKSATIVFTGQQKCEVVEEQVSNPSPHDVLVHTVVSLTSTGTESFCYRGVFDTGTGWSNWVNYPFYPGYSAVGEITEVGSNVSSLKVGDRVYTGANHKEYHLTRPENVVRLPDNVSCEAAAWSTLATITQTVVRRAEHAMGDTAVVIGLGPLGQLVTQYLRTIGLGDILVIDYPNVWQPQLDSALQQLLTVWLQTQVILCLNRQKGNWLTWYMTSPDTGKCFQQPCR